MHVSNANLFKKMVCLSFNLQKLIPSPFGPVYVTSANLSDLRHSITSPGCHLLRQSLVAIHNAMELQKSWMQQLVIFAFIFQWCGDRSFALPIGGMSLELTKEQIDMVTLEDAKVNHEQLAEMPQG